MTKDYLKTRYYIDHVVAQHIAEGLVIDQAHFTYSTQIISANETRHIFTINEEDPEYYFNRAENHARYWLGEGRTRHAPSATFEEYDD